MKCLAPGWCAKFSGVLTVAAAKQETSVCCNRFSCQISSKSPTTIRQWHSTKLLRECRLSETFSTAAAVSSTFNAVGVGAGVLSRAKKGLSYTMAAGRAGTAVLCLLCIGLAAALPGSLTFEERDTCFGALDMLRACNTDMSSQDVQQLCCIPFYALEGMNCFWSVTISLCNM